MKLPFFQNVFVGTYVSAETEANSFRASEKGKVFDRKTISVLIITALCLALSKYLSDSFYLYKT